MSTVEAKRVPIEVSLAKRCTYHFAAELLPWPACGLSHFIVNDAGQCLSRCVLTNQTSSQLSADRRQRRGVRPV
jgi:hypothetical protein